MVIGRGITVREGSDVCLLAMGNMVAPSLEAATLLQDRGVSAKVVSMHTVKPLDHDLLRDVLGRFAVVAIVEEHSHIGGLGSAVAEWAAAQESHTKARLLSLATPDLFLPESGSQKYLRKRFGLTPDAIADAVARAYQAENKA